MRGCRPVTADEFKQVRSSFTGRYAVRNAALWVLGCLCGYRIGELRSLRVCDVFQFGQITDRVEVRRSAMKGKIESRTVVLHTDVKAALENWLAVMKTIGWFADGSYLFRSQAGRNLPITGSQAARILKKNFRAQEMTGKLSCHSMRKFFAESVFSRLNRDIVKLQRAMGHKNIASTVHYLSFRQEEIDQAILAI